MASYISLTIPPSSSSLPHLLSSALKLHHTHSYQFPCDGDGVSKLMYYSVMFPNKLLRTPEQQTYLIDCLLILTTMLFTALCFNIVLIVLSQTCSCPVRLKISITDHGCKSNYSLRYVLGAQASCNFSNNVQ